MNAGRILLTCQLFCRTLVKADLYCQPPIGSVIQKSFKTRAFLESLVPPITACQSGCQQSTMSDHESGSEGSDGDSDDRPFASGGPLTRQRKSVRSVQLDYEKLSLEERRANYRCRDGYYPLSDPSVTVWPAYARIKKLSGGKPSSNTYPVNTRLNEKIAIFTGDITTLEIDCIVNAANRTLLGGGGVDGAIHRAAGPNLKIESGSLAPCETGEAKITYGYNLPAKYVIHTVGPIGEKPDALESGYLNCLELAVAKNLKSIAFPCISTGVYGYPNKKAALVVLRTVREWLEKNDDKMDRIIFCLFMREDIEIYNRLLQDFFPLKENERSADE
uniref:Macro domain-containing protein n=1 Tax=Plectus sambesii TaxID=2011161 RepID=A0A914W6V8_9BILA